MCLAASRSTYQLSHRVIQRSNLPVCNSPTSRSLILYPVRTTAWIIATAPPAVSIIPELDLFWDPGRGGVFLRCGSLHLRSRYDRSCSPGSLTDPSQRSDLRHCATTPPMVIRHTSSSCASITGVPPPFAACDIPLPRTHEHVLACPLP